MKQWKRAWAAVVCCLMLVSVIFQSGLAVSAAEEPDFAGYKAISTKKELDAVRNDLSGKYYLTQDIEFTEEDFAVGGDFYNDGQGWTPIGTDSKPFIGIFDGNSHTIKGLKIDAVNIRYIGLFGYNSGTILNLGMVDGDITGTLSPSIAIFYVGGIAGRNYYGTLNNCYNTGSVSASSSITHSYSYAGGIAGQNSSGTLSNCYNTGSVSASASSSGNADSYAGGIAGDNGGTISNCYNTGGVSSSASYMDYAGGIAGYNENGTISNCYNTGSVSGENHVGGIAGHNHYRSATISDCYNTGSVTGDYRAGGIAGANSGTISNCYNIGSVSVSSFSSYAGGIAGDNGGTISNCYNTGSVSAFASISQSYTGGIAGYNRGGTISNCYNTGSVSGSYAGGIAGYNDGGTISKCYNTGSVSASPSYSSHVGGIAGYNYSRATISNCYNAGSVSGENHVGGIAGDNSGTISNCYNIGSVSASSSYSYAGGIAGDNYSGGVIRNCYYLNNIVQGVGNETNTAFSRTMQQMKQQATFREFDFDKVWTMEGNTTYPFPELQAVPMQDYHVHTITLRYLAPTVTKDGAWQRYCTECKQVIDSEVIPKGHPFTDVTNEKDWSYPYAVYGKAYKLFKNEKFNGSSSITRGEFVTTLCRTDLDGFLTEEEILAKYKNKSSVKQDFSDMKDSDWFAPYARYMKDLGIVGGDNTGRFNGNANITREEVAAMMHRLVKLVDPNEKMVFIEKPVDKFTDMSAVASWFKADVEWARKSGLFAGDAQKRMNPKANNSRLEMAIVLQRVTMTYKGIIAI